MSFELQWRGFQVKLDAPAPEMRAFTTMYGSNSPEPPGWVKKWHADLQQAYIDMITTGVGSVHTPDVWYEKSPIATAIQEHQR
ncbi:hypothetical protein RDI61_15940 [Pseudomonas plecoglossicida]|uniref:hypothetical protein n=1 Tax=Pseudomonas putida group TaxID=136845 RepID=UPI00240FA651|nr:MULTISPECIES: hypothetical protein [Pseudomonas putida group]MDQ7965526.1 hypothetical protein [Pseudomonas plecoglossicida]WFG03759.1 hypothetical protein P3X84_03775 [Pseudomonas putida]